MSLEAISKQNQDEVTSILSQLLKDEAGFTCWTAHNEYFQDLKSTLPLSIRFRVVSPFEPDDKGNLRYTVAGFKLYELMKSGAIEIVLAPGSEAFGEVRRDDSSVFLSPINQTLRYSSTEELPNDFDFYIRKVDLLLLKQFALSATSTYNDNELSLIQTTFPNQIIKKTDSGWVFDNQIRTITADQTPNLEQAILLMVARDNNINLIGDEITVPKDLQESVAMQIINKMNFFKEHGQFVQKKLNDLIQVCMAKKGMNALATSSKNQGMVNDCLVVHTADFDQYAVLNFLQSKGLIKMEPYPRSKDQTWGIIEVDLPKLQSMNVDSFGNEFQQYVSYCQKLEKLTGLSWRFTGLEFLCSESPPPDQVELLKFITGHCRDSDTFEAEEESLYKNLLKNKEKFSVAATVGIPNPDKIKWLEATQAYRDAVQKKLNEYIDAYNKTLDKNKDRNSVSTHFDFGLQNTVLKSSPILLILEELEMKNIISLNKKEDTGASYFGRVGVWTGIQIAEVHDLEKFNAVLDKEILALKGGNTRRMESTK